MSAAHRLLTPPPACEANMSKTRHHGSCSADTLLYIGADLDVHMLQLMQPWERQAIFVDSFHGDSFYYGPSAQNGTNDSPLAHYTREHRNDRRSAWRDGSGALRPCTGMRCVAPLTQKLIARMKQVLGFMRIHELGNLTVRFELCREPGVKRTLRYVMAETHDFFGSLLIGTTGVTVATYHRHQSLGAAGRQEDTRFYEQLSRRHALLTSSSSESNEYSNDDTPFPNDMHADIHDDHELPSPLRRALANRLSTLAMPGAAGNVKAPMMPFMLAPACLRHVTLLSSPAESDEVIDLVRGCRSRLVGEPRTLPYPGGDTLAGRRLASSRPMQALNVSHHGSGHLTGNGNLTAISLARLMGPVHEVAGLDLARCERLLQLRTRTSSGSSVTATSDDEANRTPTGGDSDGGTCAAPACSSTVLAAHTGGHTCGARMNWLQSPMGGSHTPRGACERVANEFPNECGACQPPGTGGDGDGDQISLEADEGLTRFCVEV